uniref:hypothetical protein n=1 Tax=Ruminococcus bromii TaxID=40518 RepID=UPI003FEFDDCC
TVSQLNKQTNNSAKSEVNTLMGDFKTFLLDYRLPAAAPTGFTMETGETWDADDGINTISEMKYALTEFAKDAKATKGADVLDTSDHKAGDHKFKYAVTKETDGKITVTFSCKGKGTNAADIEAKYTYSDVLAG